MKQETNPIERTSMFWASNDDSWHTTETVAAVTELSTSTLLNWRAQGQGPIFFKSGKLVFYRKKDIVTWFKSFQPSQSLAA
jgi:hypothetical protein